MQSMQSNEEKPHPYLIVDANEQLLSFRPQKDISKGLSDTT
jgi:hypothetical protein